MLFAQKTYENNRNNVIVGLNITFSIVYFSAFSFDELLMDHITLILLFLILLQLQTNLDINHLTVEWKMAW